jgi:hypothetical protein
MRNNKLKSKFRPGYSGTIHGLFYIKTQTGAQR